MYDHFKYLPLRHAVSHLQFATATVCTETHQGETPDKRPDEPSLRHLPPVLADDMAGGHREQTGERAAVTSIPSIENKGRVSYKCVREWPSAHPERELRLVVPHPVCLEI